MSDKFTFMKIGNDSIVNGLKFKRNVMVVDDLSKVESFITIGDGGEMLNLDAEGNELHTPDSYHNKLLSQRQVLKSAIEAAKDEINGIGNDLVSQKIKNQLSDAFSQPLDQDGEWNFTRILRKTLPLSVQVGCGLLTAAISHYLGFS